MRDDQMHARKQGQARIDSPLNFFEDWCIISTSIGDNTSKGRMMFFYLAVAISS